MFRLVDDAFEENNELHTIAVECLTKTIKIHLDYYFEEGYENTRDEELYKKVKWDITYSLFPKELINDMINVGIDIHSFLPKKIAQFMLLLNKQEEETPDIFIEYILDKMMFRQLNWGFDFTRDEIEDKKVQLKKLLRSYAKDELDITDTKERNKFVKDNIILLTDFTSLLGVEKSDDNSLAFWDCDYDFFDEFGFINMLKQSAYGVLANRGYGIDYVKSIFTSVGETVPFII